jgi:proline racemase
MNTFFQHFNWQSPDHWPKIKTIDMHTGGEPLRIPVAGLPPIKGHSVLEKRRFFQQNYDQLRTSLMFEPRGHADMYGAIVSSPSSPDADFDVFFPAQ